MIERRREERSHLPRGVLQFKILETLWGSGPSRVWDVVDRLGSLVGSRLNYNTVAAALNELHGRGFVDRIRVPSSNSFRYSARVSLEQLKKMEAVGILETLFARYQDPRIALSFLVDVVAEVDCRLLADLALLVERRRQEQR
jgi:predicted transcriptional regulator